MLNSQWPWVALSKRLELCASLPLLHLGSLGLQPWLLWPGGWTCRYHFCSFSASPPPVLQSTIRCTRCWISLDSWCVGQRYLWVMVVLLGVDWNREKRQRKCLIYHHDADFIKPICTPWIKQGYPKELPIGHQKVDSLRLLQWERVIWGEVSKRISQEVRGWPKTVKCDENLRGLPLYLRALPLAQLEKNPPAMQETRFDTWVRKIHWRRNRLPTPVFFDFPCDSAGKESACNVGDLNSILGLGRSPGEEKGYPLQYSGLENSMDCIVHEVAKSWTWLNDFHFHFP